MSHPNEFHFVGFEPTHATRTAAARALGRILDQAPFGAAAVALLELDRGASASYRCAVEIQSQSGPFLSSACAPTAEEAVASVEQALRRKFAAWRERRFDDRGRETAWRSDWSIA